MQLTTPMAPSTGVVRQHLADFQALGATDAVETSYDEVTVKFGAPHSGYQFHMASTVLRDSVNGAKLVVENTSDSPIPRLFPSDDHVVRAIELLDGVKYVEQSGPTDNLTQVIPSITVVTETQARADQLMALLRDTTPLGTGISYRFDLGAAGEKVVGPDVVQG